MAETKPAGAGKDAPRSLQGHTVPEERMASIRPLVAMLAETALRVSQELPFQADAADFVAVLEREGDKA